MHTPMNLQSQHHRPPLITLLLLQLTRQAYFTCFALCSSSSLATVCQLTVESTGMKSLPYTSNTFLQVSFHQILWKNLVHILLALILSNLKRFSKFFYRWKLYNI